jgi:hypothetical protein
MKYEILYELDKMEDFSYTVLENMVNRFWNPADPKNPQYMAAVDGERKLTELMTDYHLVGV